MTNEDATARELLQRWVTHPRTAIYQDTMNYLRTPQQADDATARELLQRLHDMEGLADDDESRAWWADMERELARTPQQADGQRGDGAADILRRGLSEAVTRPTAETRERLLKEAIGGALAALNAAPSAGDALREANDA